MNVCPVKNPVRLAFSGVRGRTHGRFAERNGWMGVEVIRLVERRFSSPEHFTSLLSDSSPSTPSCQVLPPRGDKHHLRNHDHNLTS
jgi:hypothetical protein